MTGDLNRVVAMIPARGGSKSIPGKNLAMLRGKPLLSWSIDAAAACPCVDRVIVSTDDAEIARTAQEMSAEAYTRRPALATDDALVIDAIRDLIITLRGEGETAGVMVVLEPTCPLRSVDDIEQCVEHVRGGFDSAATFTAAATNPHRAWRITPSGPEPFIAGAVPWLPRQQLPEAYQLDGGVYAFRIDGLTERSLGLVFGRSAAVVTPKERAVDIDHPDDLLRAETILRARHKVTRLD